MEVVLTKKQEKQKSAFDYHTDYVPVSAVREAVTIDDFLNIKNTTHSGIRLLTAPISIREKIFLKLMRAIGEFWNKEKVQFPIQTIKTPLRWALLLIWLKKNNVPCLITTPLYNKIANDVPKRFSAFVGVDKEQYITDGHTPAEGPYGNGTSQDPDIAASKAFGEFIERYFFTAYRQKDITYASHEMLGKKKRLNPLTIDNFNDMQKATFPHYFDHDKDTIFGWVTGRDLILNKPALIPAQLIYWNYKRQAHGEKQEPVLYEQNTSGQAGHFTREHALLAGLQELIERDAFFIHWLKKIPPPKIAHESIQDESIRKILDEFKLYQYQVEICDLTIDTHQHVIVAIVIDRSVFNGAVMVGSAARSNIYDAIRDSLSEVISSCTGMRSWIENDFSLPEDFTPFTDMRISRSERMQLSANPKNFRHYEWFIQGNEYNLSEDIPISETVSPSKTLEILIKHMQNMNYDVYMYEVKNKILEKLDYHLVKVIVPKLFPMYLTEMHVYLNHPRLHHGLPQKYSMYALRTCNTHPHPLP